MGYQNSGKVILSSDKTQEQWKLQLDSKIQVSYDWNESTLGFSSNIFHP